MKFFMKTFSAFMIGMTALSSISVSALAANNNKQHNFEEVTINFAGDCTLGADSRYNTLFNTQYNLRGKDWFFSNVKKIFKEDDLTLVNFEGTLTSSTHRAYKKFTFKGPKKYTGILKSGSVEAVNIANNHSHDFGAQSFSDTKAALSKANILYSGYDKISYTKIRGVKIAMIGTCVLDGTSTAHIRSMVKKAKDRGAELII